MHCNNIHKKRQQQQQQRSCLRWCVHDSTLASLEPVICCFIVNVTALPLAVAAAELAAAPQNGGPALLAVRV